MQVALRLTAEGLSPSGMFGLSKQFTLFRNLSVPVLVRNVQVRNHLYPVKQQVGPVRCSYGSQSATEHENHWYALV